jgi:hypothetical protein
MYLTRMRGVSLDAVTMLFARRSAASVRLALGKVEDARDDHDFDALLDQLETLAYQVEKAAQRSRGIQAVAS